MEVLTKVLRVFFWIVGLLWFTMFLIAIVYKNDPIVRGAVRAVSVSIAGIFTDTRELQKDLMDETKKELKR